MYLEGMVFIAKPKLSIVSGICTEFRLWITLEAMELEMPLSSFLWSFVLLSGMNDLFEV